MDGFSYKFTHANQTTNPFLKDRIKVLDEVVSKQPRNAIH
jgi:hypothetical protein